MPLRDTNSIVELENLLAYQMYKYVPFSISVVPEIEPYSLWMLESSVLLRYSSSLYIVGVLYVRITQVYMWRTFNFSQGNITEQIFPCILEYP